MRSFAARGPLGLAALLLLAVLWSQARFVSPTNFYGYDEWTVLSLVSAGVIDIPYANRPLALLWALPVPFIAGDSFLPFVILRWAYAWLSAVLVVRVTLRLMPGRPLLAFLAGAFVLVWAPSDEARLSLVESALYSGITFGMTLSLAAFVESWARRSVPLLLVAGALAVVSGRCYEATLPVLMLCPLLLLVGERPSRGLLQWACVFEAFVALALALAVIPMLLQNQGLAYQESVGLDTRLTPMLERLARQYGFHFGPLVAPSPQEFAAHAAPLAIAIAVFLGAALLWSNRVPSEGARGDLLSLLAVAFLLAGAGYAALVVTGRVPGAWRAEFLSAPGAGWLLAGLAVAGGERSRRLGRVVTLGLGVWVVALGTVRSSAMQTSWNSFSFYSRQTQLLSDLVAAVPDTPPQTLIVLIDESRAWRANFSFHHALEYLYRGRATGLVAGARPGMLPAYFTPQGIVSEPMAVVRGPWRTGVRLFRYDQVIVVRHGPAGAVVLEEWPRELPPLPAGSSYRPVDRLRSLAQAIPERRALRSLEVFPQLARKTR